MKYILSCRRQKERQIRPLEHLARRRRKMKIVGITAEYNPFHKGHRYHLEKSKEMTGADCAVVVMSGDFTQRGEAAVFDKWARSRAAVDEGADLVVELPFIYACNIAGVFARGAVDILEGLGASYISFGSESGDIDALKATANGMEKQKENIDDERRMLMKEGHSYARSTQLATERVLGKDVSGMMESPNDILAIEYMKRIVYWEKKGRTMIPAAVKRYGSGYYDADDRSGFAGAAAIRTMMENGEDVAAGYVTESTKRLMDGISREDVKRWKEEAFRIVRSDIVRSENEALAQVYCMGEGLENRFKKEVTGAGDWDELIRSMVSKRYTAAAIRRIMIYMMMGLREKEPPMAVYARVLAAGERGRKLIRSLKERDEETIPVITNINRDRDHDVDVMHSLELDSRAADMYNIITGRDLYEDSDRVRKPYMRGL